MQRARDLHAQLLASERSHAHLEVSWGSVSCACKRSCTHQFNALCLGAS
jgi:hypothetical protein